MYNESRQYLKPESKLADMVYNNPSLLYVLEYFEVDYILQDKTVAEFCAEHNIDANLFTTVSNIYNGFVAESKLEFGVENIPLIIKFLHNTHAYYLNEKYPEIRNFIDELRKVNSSTEIGIVEKFFTEYYAEVNEHLDYEDRVAFPYINALYNKYIGTDSEPLDTSFSAKVYRKHHTDINYKLDELKSLLIKYISVREDRQIRRRLLLSLCDVESNLYAHSVIEEQILMPLVMKVERNLNKVKKQ